MTLLFYLWLRRLIEQGNTLVALLARRWPEARLRKQIEALGIEDQPLARWALFHALKPKEISFSRSAAQRGSDACGSCPPSSRDLRLSENVLESTVSKPPVKAGEAASALRCVEETPETIKRIQRASGQADSADDKWGRERTSKLRIGAVYDTTYCTPLQMRHQTEPLSFRMGFPNSSVLAKRGDSKGRGEGASTPKEGNKLASRPASVATRSRLQAAADRKMKPVDSTVKPTPTGARHPLPPLPVGKIVLQGPAGSACRDSYRRHQSQAAFTRNSARGETSSCKKESSTATPPAASRRYSSRQTMQCKEDHGQKACEAQDHLSKPASFSSPSRRSIAQRKISLDNGGAPVHRHTSGNLRATQPPSLIGSLPNSRLPSRMTCGTVLPTCKDIIKRQSVESSANETKEHKRETRLFQDLTPRTSTGAHVASPDHSFGIPNDLQSQNTSTSLPVQHQKPTAQEEYLGLISDSSAATVPPHAAAGRNASVKGVLVSPNLPQRTENRAPADLYPSRSSGTHIVHITTQGSSGGRPKDTEAEVVPEDHTIKFGQKSALPSRDVTSRGLKITPHFQETSQEDRRAVANLRPQIDVNKGSPGLATAAAQAEPYGQVYQPQLPSSAAPRILGSSLDMVSQHKGDAVRDSRNAQNFVPYCVARGTLPGHPQQFQLSASQQPGRQWAPGIGCEIPRRSSLPESYSKGLQSYGGNVFVQHQPVILGHADLGGLQWPTRILGQPPVLPPRNPGLYGHTQQTSFQQHPLSVPQQYFASQSHQLQRAVPNQQQGAGVNMHYIMRGIGSEFIARQRQHTGIPIPGGWRNR